MKFEKKRAENTAVQMAPAATKESRPFFSRTCCWPNSTSIIFAEKCRWSRKRLYCWRCWTMAFGVFRTTSCRRTRKKQLLFAEAQAWLFSDESNGIFSFVSICALLGFDPGYIRRGLRQWQQRALAARRKKQRGSGPVPQRLVA